MKRRRILHVFNGLMVLLTLALVVFVGYRMLDARGWTVVEIDGAVAALYDVPASGQGTRENAYLLPMTLGWRRGDDAQQLVVPCCEVVLPERMDGDGGLVEINLRMSSFPWATDPSATAELVLVEPQITLICGARTALASKGLLGQGYSYLDRRGELQSAYNAQFGVAERLSPEGRGTAADGVPYGLSIVINNGGERYITEVHPGLEPSALTSLSIEIPRLNGLMRGSDAFYYTTDMRRMAEDGGQEERLFVHVRAGIATRLGRRLATDYVAQIEIPYTVD